MPVPLTILGVRIVSWNDGAIVAVARMAPLDAPVLCVLVAFDPNRRKHLARLARIYAIITVDEDSWDLISRGAVPQASWISSELRQRVYAQVRHCVRSASGNIVLMRGDLESGKSVADYVVLSAGECRGEITWIWMNP